MPVPFNIRGINPPQYVSVRDPDKPLSDMVTEQGIGAAAGALFQRIGRSLIEQGDNERAAQVEKQATIEGAAAGDAAAADLAAPSLTDEETLAGRAYDQAQIRAWQARMDLSVSQAGEQILADHPDDPEMVAAKWQAVTEGLRSALPPQIATGVNVALDARGARLVDTARGTLLKRQEGKANASLIDGISANAKGAANAWRQGDTTYAAGLDQTVKLFLDARTDLTPQAKAQMWQGYQQDRRRDAVLGEFERVKARGLGAAEAFIRGFADPKTHPDFDPDHRDALATEMDRDLGQMRAEHQVAVAKLHDETRTALDLAARGYQVPQLDGLIARAGRLDPELGARVAAERADILDIQSMAKLPPAALAARVSDLKNRADTEPDLERKATLARRHQGATLALQRTVQALDADPLAHAGRQGVVTLGALDLSAPKPDALAARATARDTAARYYGTAMPLLTRPEADALAQSVAAAAPEEMAGRVTALAQTYGAHWPEVYGELVQSKSAPLPPEVRVLATTDSPLARVKLAEGFRLGRDTVRKGIDADAAKAIDADIPDRLAPLAATLAHVPDGPRIKAEYENAAKLLAYQYSRTRPWAEAANAAVNDLIGAKYDFMLDDRYLARAPKGIGDRMRDFTDIYQSALKPADLAVPAARPGETLNEDQRRDAYLSAVRRGRWVTNRADTGWLLLDPVGNPVKMADGSRLELPFSLVTQRGYGEGER